MDKERLKKLLKIDQKKEQVKKIEKRMADPDFWQNRERATELSQRMAQIKEIIQKFEESDTADSQTELETQALLQGKYDHRNAFLTISAGTGGVDAQDWAEMLLRVYLRFAESQGWIAKILNKKTGKEAGIKNATLSIKGMLAYGYLKAESGVHRLVRKSPFNAQNLRQTSFALVDVIPEIENKEIELKNKDLKFETFRASGPGGQSVNTTDSAVRVTYLPSNDSVSVQNEKSQLQNKRVAVKILAAKLARRKEEEQKIKLQKAKGEIKTAKWGNQIRSYVLDPYQQVKDHRTGESSKDVDSVLDGRILPFIKTYLREVKRLKN